MTAVETNPTELIIVRHAPAITGGRVAGRRDVAADCSDARAFAGLRDIIGAVDHIFVSPALRCQQTLAQLWPDANAQADARLWEQDFGDWEGRAYGDLPDLGALGLADLAAHRPPNGESFHDVAARCTPALREAALLGGKVAVIAHAGIVRAALGMALGAIPQGLAFQVAALSMTRITSLPGPAWSVAGVNWIPPSLCDA